MVADGAHHVAPDRRDDHRPTATTTTTRPAAPTTSRPPAARPPPDRRPRPPQRRPPHHDHHPTAGAHHHRTAADAHHLAGAGGLSSDQLGSNAVAVNAKRATGTTCGGTAQPPVPALTLQSQISAAADAHARDMATRNYFSHTGAGGSDPGQRMTAAGYRWSAWAENIAAGQATPAAAVDGWFASAGHCRNFMSSTVTQIGFGKAEHPVVDLPDLLGRRPGPARLSGPLQVGCRPWATRYCTSR